MKAKKRAPATWRTTRTPNLKQYVSSGVYFAHARVNGKLIRRSLETTVFSTAQLRLGDFLREERAKAERGTPALSGKIIMAEAVELFRQSVRNNLQIKDSSKAYRMETIGALLRTWPGFEKLDARRVTEAHCEE